MSLRAIALLLGAMVLVPLPFVSAAGEGASNAPTSFLVGFEPGDRDEAIAAIRGVGGNVTGAIPAIDVLIVRLPAGAASVLAQRNPAISFVEADAKLTPAGAEWNGAQWDGAQWNGAQWNGAQWDGAQWNGAQWNGAQWDGTVDPGLANGWQWGLEAAGVPQAWDTEQGGRSAAVCVVDSGVDASHRDLSPYVKKKYNAIDNSTNVADAGGHGTHVAGIASATHREGWGIAGVSNSTVYASKVLDANGAGSASALARGLLWCGDNGADVVVMALTLQGGQLTVTRALDQLAAKDVVMVASAGNAGPCSDCVSFPARDPRVIAVAATDRSGALARFSSTGPEVDLRAPGVDILSDLPGDAFGYGSGTSQSAAFVAGAAALLLEAKPGLSASGVRSALIEGSAGGKLDVLGALGEVTTLRVAEPDEGTTNSTDGASSGPTTNATTAGTTTTTVSTTTEPLTTTTETVENTTATAPLDDTTEATLAPTINESTNTTTQTVTDSSG